MDKKILIPTILFLIILPVSIYALSNEKSAGREATETPAEIAEPEIILYFSDQCSHCLVVEEYLEKNDVASKISFVQKNVRIDIKNGREFLTKKAVCGMSDDNSIPFLWDGTAGDKCLNGDVAIIEYFQNKLNAQ